MPSLCHVMICDSDGIRINGDTNYFLKEKSDMIKKDLYKYLVEYDIQVLCYSPTFTTGVSINEEYFDKDVVAVATSTGDVVGLENFKAYYGNYITGFSDGELI